MNLPRVLVVDDQFGRNATEQIVFLMGIGLAGEKVGAGETAKAYAEFKFCSGQRVEDYRLINDYDVVRNAVASENWALVLLDVQFDSGERDVDGCPRGQPGDDLFGMTIRRELSAEFPDIPVVMLTGKRQDEIGETDSPFLSKHRLGPYELRRALLRFGRLDADACRALLAVDAGVCVEDPAGLAAFRQAFVHAGTDVSVLILGESGVGKEVLARYLHRCLPRSAGPFLAVNVAAIPRDLVESELFGIGKRVASSVDARTGKFELAAGGTLFLDEVGDMPLEVQAKVLRALQERKIVRVGESEEIPLDIRLVCATSRDLANLAVSGQFRSDLLYRINTVPISIPPLRDRRLDIAPLASRFLGRFSAKQGKIGVTFTASAIAALEAIRFPGNVRELENLVERLVSSAGHHQSIGEKDVREELNSNQHAFPDARSRDSSPGTAQSSACTTPAMPSLAELPEWLDRIAIAKDDPALKGIKTQLDTAVQHLVQRLTGAALERCRNPIDNTLNRQSAVRYLTGDAGLKGKAPARIINEILGRAQESALSDTDLEHLVETWRSSSGAVKHH